MPEKPKYALASEAEASLADPRLILVCVRWHEIQTHVRIMKRGGEDGLPAREIVGGGDMLDAVLDLEAQWFEEGFEAGQEEGRKRSIADGKTTGYVCSARRQDNDDIDMEVQRLHSLLPGTLKAMK
jgi:hypothetical protein